MTQPIAIAQRHKPGVVLGSLKELTALLPDTARLTEFKYSSDGIELKAAFKNDPQVLWPGQFVGLRMEVGIDLNAVVAPAAAVQDGQDSSFVFVIKPDKTAEMRKVVVDRTANEESVIRSGLEGGEQVVIDGQSRLTIGSPVEIVPHDAAPVKPAAPATPAPQKP